MPYVSAQTFKIKTRDISAQMMSMSPDVNQDHRAADSRRIKSPSGRHILSGKVSLNVLKMKLADGADRTGPYHGSGLTPPLGSSVAEREAKLQAGCLKLIRTA